MGALGPAALVFPARLWVGHDLLHAAAPMLLIGKTRLRVGRDLLHPRALALFIFPARGRTAVRPAVFISHCGASEKLIADSII